MTTQTADVSQCTLAARMSEISKSILDIGLEHSALTTTYSLTKASGKVLLQALEEELAIFTDHVSHRLYWSLSIILPCTLLMLRCPVCKRMLNCVFVWTRCNVSNCLSLTDVTRTRALTPAVGVMTFASRVVLLFVVAACLGSGPLGIAGRKLTGEIATVTQPMNNAWTWNPWSILVFDSACFGT